MPFLFDLAKATPFAWIPEWIPEWLYVSRG